jgi:hypothetical protein
MQVGRKKKCPLLLGEEALTYEYIMEWMQD